MAPPRARAHAPRAADSGGDVVKFTATIRHFLWPKGGIVGADGNDSCIVILEGVGLPVEKAKGRLMGAAVGKCFDFEGTIDVHPTFGPSLKVSRAVLVLPRTPEAIRSYLVTLPHIGPVTARSLVRAFGTDAIAALQEKTIDEIREAMETRAFTESDLGDIREALRADKTDMDLNLRVRSLLGAVGTESVVKRVIDMWKTEAPARIQRNPWSLARLPGIGFLRADAVAEHLGVEMRDPNRIRAGLRHAIDEIRGSGHTRVLRGTLLHETQKLLGYDRAEDGYDLCDRILGEAIDDGDYVAVAADGSAIELASDFRCEQEIAERLARRLAGHREPIRPFNIYAELFNDQETALRSILATGHGGTFVLTGMPGTGKTTLMRQMLPHFPVHRIRLCAPTGKAARRLREQAGMIATTIHSMLEPIVRRATAGDGEPDENAKKSQDGGSLAFTFGCNEANPIDADLVVVDEASMIDIYLFRDLLRAIPDGCYLLIVGDPNQLPSVGVGAVLRDLLRSEVVPQAQLTTIKRQNPGLLLTHIHEVKAGRWTPVRNSPANDLCIMDAGSEEHAVEVMCSLYLDRLPKWLLAQAEAKRAAGEHVDDPDPLQDIQILMPWRSAATRKFCTETVNKVIQRRRAESGDVQLLGKWAYGVGDKVIQTRNDYKIGIVNGDIGTVLAIEETEEPLTTFATDDAYSPTLSTTTSTPTAAAATPARKRWVYRIQFVGYDQTHNVPANPSSNDLELAYAVTIHKYQGSQAPVIVLPAIGTESSFYDRSLFYTGLSRAATMAVLVGKQEGLQRVISRVQPDNRQTSLVKLLREALPSGPDDGARRSADATDDAGGDGEGETEAAPANAGAQEAA